MIDALPSLLTPLNIAGYLIAINLGAWAAFGIDKLLARRKKARVSERTLLVWAALGGTPGAYLARRMFRHKTRKQPFSRNLHTVAALQVLVCGFLLWRSGVIPTP